MDRVFLLLIVLTITSLGGFTQNNDRKIKAEKFLKSKNLKIKNLDHTGFELHFNCDSIPFLKQTAGDSTKIWTAMIISWYEQDELIRKIENNKFGRTQYINSIGEDGRFELVDMHETIFISRNDSLYQMDRFIKPKLIFHPAMFSGGQNSVKLKKKYNYQGDKIFLGKKWVENGLTNYTIIITNKGKNTEYSFTFDPTLRFINWENCKK